MLAISPPATIIQNFLGFLFLVLDYQLHPKFIL